ncbi:hypothetical protein NFI96_026619 [Prochilodus magdalenae]|nr:hypothetical protein NFI96_026619 [Prochilodus magdalenae]
MVLLGKNSSEISRVGNFILSREAFDTEAPPPSVEQHSERARGKVDGRYITLISTPHLLNPQLTAIQLNKRVMESMSLCAPGPHIIVLILQPDDFTETERHRLNHILRSLSKDVHKYTLTITTHMLQSGSRADPSTETVSQKITREYSKGHSEFNSKSSPSALVKMMEKMVVENGGSHLQWEEYVKAQAERELHQPEQTPTKSEPKQLERKTTQLKKGLETQEKLSERLNLVLCGSDGAVKSSISDLILVKREYIPESGSVCVKREGAVCGRLVTLVEMPALYNTQLSEEEVMQESLRCVSLCDPGVHAFLLIVPDGPLTDEDKRELEKTERIFGSRIKSYLFLITQHSQNKPLCEAVQPYGEVHLINSRTDAEELIQCVRKRLGETNGSHFTTAMYVGAQIESHLYKYQKEIEDLKHEIRDLRMGRINQTQVDSSPEMRDLRVVLLGKTGVGKSATGNTILGRKAFKDLLSSRSVTSVCQKKSAEVRGRQISVIDTPGLFDTGVANEELRKEISKCITMAAPGPHVFLLVLALGRFTQEEEEAVKMIQDLFGEESSGYTMVLFTRGDDLEGMEMSIEDFIKDSDRSLQNIIHQCGNRYHAFNNRLNDHSQVTALLEKIDSMVAVNGGSCYTNEMFQQTEKALKEEQERILKEREEEIERQKEELKMKHEAEMEQMKKTMEEERQKQERDKKVREEEFKEREEQIKRESAEREQSEREHYNRRREEDEKRMKELKAEINREREENRKRWEKQREKDQRQREQEEEERKKKEEEWRKKQREEKEKFEKEKDEMIQKQKADQQKVQREYEQKAAEEEKRRTELEEKIKHAEESKKKELLELQLTQQREWQWKKQEEEKRRKEEESKWKEIMESKEKEWQIQEHKKKEQYEQERKTEMERRAREEEQRKRKEEEEKRRIESEANEKIKQIQQTMENQRETEKKEREEKYKRDLEEKLWTQREKFEKQEEERERVYKGEEERNLEKMRKMYEQEKEKLRRETEKEAREQAEREFCRRLEDEVKQAKAEGYKAGAENVEAQRTRPGRLIDAAVNKICKSKIKGQ